MADFPDPNAALTTILVVDDLEDSKNFYVDLLGASLYREYGGTSVVLEFLGNWLLLVTGGGPTRDKPTVSFVAPSDPDQVNTAFTIRVADCGFVYETLRERGVPFLTPPTESEGGGEVRCFFRDPSGHLLEISSVGS